MKEIFTCIFILFLAFGKILGQTIIDTTYFDLNFEECEKNVHEYYRVSYKKTNDSLIVRDFWKTGELQMKGQYEPKFNDSKFGIFQFYYKSGALQAKVVYKNNIPIGESEYYNEDGSFGFAYIATLDSLDNKDEMVYNFGKFYKYLKRNLKYPREARRNKIEGQILVTCYIGPNQIPEVIQIKSGKNKIFNEEVDKVVRSYRKWGVPRYKGKPTYIGITFPINYEL